MGVALLLIAVLILLIPFEGRGCLLLGIGIVLLMALL